MKVNGVNDTVVERNGLASDGQFTIAFNAKMARILSDGLYSDKIKSIIRELSCNAIDSHVENGNVSEPIEVHLPSMLEPHFHVRDFGVGLDHDQVVNIYTCYGASTKTESDDFIGQLGLGSKAPFSYADAFQVTARKNGIERHYSMYKSETGMPSCALMGENPTKERNGVTVSMPVKSSDFRAFQDKAAQVFKWFTPIPKITGNSNFTIPKVNTLFSGNKWKITENTRHETASVIALMGRVAYPIDSRSLTGLSTVQAGMFSLPMVLEFDIGDIEVAASREAIGYDPRTRKNIIDKINVVINELGAQIEKRIASASTKWEAHAMWGHIFNDVGYYNLRRVFSSTGIKWKNFSINSSNVTFKYSDMYGPKQTGHACVNPVLIMSQTIGQRRPRLENRYGDTYELDTSSTIIFDDLPKGAMSRMSYYIETGNIARNTTVYLFPPSTICDWKQMEDLLCNPKVLYASKLEKRPTISKVRSVILRYLPSRNNVTNRWETTEIDIELGGVYVDLFAWTVRDNGVDRPMEDIMEAARQAGNILPANLQVYAARSPALKKKLVEHPKWIELFSLIRDKIQTTMTPTALESLTAQEQFHKLNQEVHIDTKMWKSNRTFAAGKNSEFGRYVEMMNTLDRKSAAAGKLMYVMQLSTMLDITHTTTTTSVAPLVKQANDILKNYPMITIMAAGYWRREYDAMLVQYVDQLDELAMLREEKMVAKIGATKKCVNA